MTQIFERGDILDVCDLILVDNLLLDGATRVEDIDMIINENHEEVKSGWDIDGAETVLLVRVGALLRLVQELFVDEKGKVVFVESLLVGHG